MNAPVATERWLEQVMEEHRQLKEEVENLQQFLECQRPAIGDRGYHTWAADLSGRLVRLHDHLFRHFRYEEEEGMQEELIMKHPRVTAQIEEILGEHPSMLRSLRELMTDTLAYSEGRLPEDPHLRNRLQRILQQLHDHEHAETDLLQRLEYRDCGAAD